MHFLSINHDWIIFVFDVNSVMQLSNDNIIQIFTDRNILFGRFEAKLNRIHTKLLCNLTYYFHLMTFERFCRKKISKGNNKVESQHQVQIKRY